MKIDKMRMYYGQYKKSYSDCKTVPGSYDAGTKSIEVIIPEGRMKPSGVRGQRFHGYELWMKRIADGKSFRSEYRAVSEENAMKQHILFCKKEGYQPCDPPEGREARIYW